MNFDNLVKTVMHYLLNEKRTFLNRWKEIRKPSESKEENVGIYRRYIVYREGLTRYFVKKNRRGDISVNIAKISAIYRFGEIYRRYFEKIASGGKISVIYWRYIGDISEIYRWFFCDISPPSCNMIWRPRSHPCWSDGLDVIPMVIWRSNGLIAPSFLSNGQNWFSIVN